MNEHRKTIEDALFRLNQEAPTYSGDILRKNWEKHLHDAECDPVTRLDGRVARAELSLYDAMLAEILGEHDAEKCKVRNRRKADRKHNVLPKVRKQMRYDRGWNRYASMPCFGCKNIGISEYRMNNAESVARKDWEIESEETELDAEFNFWMRKIEDERLASFNEWLKYA